MIGYIALLATPIKITLTAVTYRIDRDTCVTLL